MAFRFKKYNLGGGIIDVPELPTENISPDTFYRIPATEETAEVYVCVGRTVCTIGEFIQTLGSSFSYETHIVDTLPNTMVPLDKTTTPITGDIYIIRETGIGYLSMDGTSNTAYPASVIISDTIKAEVTDKGWIASKDAIVATDANEVYCVKTEASEEAFFKYENGKWVKYSAIIDVDALPTENINKEAIYLTNKAVTYTVFGNKALPLTTFCTSFDGRVYREINTLVDNIPETGNAFRGTEGILYTYTLRDSGVVWVYNNNEWVELATTTSGAISGGFVDNPSKIPLDAPPASIYSLLTQTLWKYKDNGWIEFKPLTSLILQTKTITKNGTYTVDDGYDALGEIVVEVEPLCEYTNNSVHEIGRYAYADATFLKTFSSNAVTSIGEGAFMRCSNLTDITIPNSVTSIGSSAFEHCTSLTSVHITDIAAWCNISFGNLFANPLYYAGNLYLNGQLITEVIIPDSVTSIGTALFIGYRSLTNITLPNSVTSIGSYAFKQCTSLTGVTIPDSVTSIGDGAFDGSGLTVINIPKNVTSVSSTAFNNCIKLATIYAPTGLTHSPWGAPNATVEWY